MIDQLGKKILIYGNVCSEIKSIKIYNKINVHDKIVLITLSTVYCVKIFYTYKMYHAKFSQNLALLKLYMS